MANILPTEYKQKIVNEYRFRLATVAAVIVAAVVLMGLIALVPSLLLVRNQVSVAEKYAAAQESDSKVQTAASVRRQIEFANQKVAILSEHAHGAAISTFTAEVVAAMPAGTFLTRLTFEEREGELQARVSGVAPTRSALLAFEEGLEELPDVLSVDLPVSHLAQDIEPPFTMTLTIAK